MANLYAQEQTWIHSDDWTYPIIQMMCIQSYTFKWLNVLLLSFVDKRRTFFCIMVLMHFLMSPLSTVDIQKREISTWWETEFWLMVCSFPSASPVVSHLIIAYFNLLPNEICFLILAILTFLVWVKTHYFLTMGKVNYFKLPFVKQEIKA